MTSRCLRELEAGRETLVSTMEGRGKEAELVGISNEHNLGFGNIEL